MRQFDIIATRADRIDAPDKATGKALYTDDIILPGMLYGALLQSPHAHANILSIDTSKAEALPGVKAVITHKDVNPIKYGVSPARYDEEVLASKKVRYVGDEIAAVAATSLAIAQEAIGLIEVEYEVLPSVLTIEDAMKDGAPQLHDEFPKNFCAEVHHEFGDVAKGMAESDIQITTTMRNSRQDGACIEMQACVAEIDSRGVLNLITATQVPHYVQRTVAMVMGMDMGKVRVRKPYVGAGFGIKASANAMELACCILTKKTNKPVKMCYTRDMVFMQSRARHQFTHKITTGAKKDGTLMAIKHECYLDGGAYSSFGIATVYYAGALLGGPYKLKNMSYDGYRIYNNKPTCGAQRGHGAVIARACFEQQMDMLAEKIGMDPLELRLKNMMEAGDTTCNDLNMSSFGMAECIEAVRDGSSWNEKKGKIPEGKGIGMASGFFVSGAGFPIYRSDTFHGTVVVKLSEDGGTAIVYTGSAEIGQGSDTAFAMIVAEAIGIPLKDVRLYSGDTDMSLDLGAYSSRQTLFTGHAAKEAGEHARAQVIEVLSEKLDVAPENINIRNGFVEFNGNTPDFSEMRTRYIKEHRGWTDNPESEKMTFKEASRMAFLERGTIVGTGKYKPVFLGGRHKGAAVGTSPAYGCSAQVAEVSVDMGTGMVSVEAITDAHDCGKAINTKSVEQQMEGSIHMGIGETLTEEVLFNEKGEVVNSDLAEYKMLTAVDMPRIKVIVVESDEPNGPYGAKEVGEGCIMPCIPAIVNAVYNATGVRFNQFPLTPERVFEGLQAKKEKEAAGDMSPLSYPFESKIEERG